MTALPSDVVALADSVWYSPGSGKFFANGYRNRRSSELREMKTRKRHLEFHFNGRSQQAHRIAWEAINGKIPDGKVIDHINGDGLDNRITNLRVVTFVENMRNYKMTRPNTSGLQGVSWIANDKKWRSQINHKGERIYLGQFASKEDAYEAYLKAKVRFHGEVSINRLKKVVLSA